MIRPLRRRHLQIWLAWLLLLPAGIISARLATPKTPVSKLLQPVSARALSVVIGTIQRDNYTARLLANADTSQVQLEWTNTRALTTPPILVYRLAKGRPESEGELLGRIDNRGTYRFALDAKTFSKDDRYLLYDIIHKKPVETITF